MNKQIIVTVGREFGSGGHYIAQKLSEKLGIQLYDKELLYEMAVEHGYNGEDIARYDEKPVNVFASRKIRDFSNSIEENVARKIFGFIKKKAEAGESFVVVGRCAEHVLRKHENVLKVFVLADRSCKVKRVSELYGVSERKALDMMKKTDARRKLYHNYYSDIKWGDTRGYDLSVNSSLLGVDKTVDMIMAVLKLM